VNIGRMQTVETDEAHTTACEQNSTLKRINRAHSDRSRRRVENTCDFHVLVYEFLCPSLIVKLIARPRERVGQNQPVSVLRNHACEYMLRVLIGSLVGCGARLLRGWVVTRRTLSVHGRACKKYRRRESKRSKHPQTSPL
jgi:hypothetical protein